MKPEPQTKDEWNWEDDNAKNHTERYENKTATRKLNGEKQKHKNKGKITRKLGKTGVNINT
eukprot:3531634-Ditylum_brightwellii.AAC.1